MGALPRTRLKGPCAGRTCASRHIGLSSASSARQASWWQKRMPCRAASTRTTQLPGTWQPSRLRKRSRVHAAAMPTMSSAPSFVQLLAAGRGGFGAAPIHMQMQANVSWYKQEGAASGHGTAPTGTRTHGTAHAVHYRAREAAHRRLSTRRCSSFATALAPPGPMRVKARSSVRRERSAPSTLRGSHRACCWQYFYLKNITRSSV